MCQILIPIYFQFTLIFFENGSNLTQICFSRCLSDQLPPMFGERKDICDGKNPTTFEQLKINTEEGTRGRWTIYLVVAIFITMLLTFCCTFAIMYFMCMKDKDRTSISPEP